MLDGVTKPAYTFCKSWMNFCLCMRTGPKLTDHIHPDLQRFDAVIVWKGTCKDEAPRKKTYDAYDVILKPASTDAAPRPPSPPKERPVSQEIIEKKLKEAEERRQSVEMAKLQVIAKGKERAEEANKRVQSLNESFSKEAEQKLTEKLEAMQQKKEAHVKALQDRLKDHAKRVATVSKAGDRAVDELKKKIDVKMTTMQMNRQAQLNTIQERIREHEKHIAQVIETSGKLSEENSKVAEEKYLTKITNALKNREEQLSGIMDRLKEHELHIQEVRKNKMNISTTEEPCAAGNDS